MQDSVASHMQFVSAVVQPDAVAEVKMLLTQYGIIIGEMPLAGEYLLADGEGLSLCRVGEKGRVKVDFASGAAQHRRIQGGGELIGKAVDYKRNETVWDATGGLGRDAFVLASLGLSVTVSEQHPVVACLLADGLRRAAADAEISAIAARIQLLYGNSATLLDKALPVDVVYLDPMYPERKKTAAVKKEMAYFHRVVGNADSQADAVLLEVARKVAKKRVVVKRPKLGEHLAGVVPDYQYSGKSTRFDVYIGQATVS